MRNLFACLLIAACLGAVPARADDADACFEATKDRDGNKSITLCDKVIKSGKLKGKRLAFAYNNRGLGYMKTDKLDLAMKDFNESLRLDPTYVYAYDNRGDVWRYRGKFDLAIKEYNEAIRRDPTFLSAYLDRAQAFQELGNVASARADYEAVLNMKGQDRAIDKWAKGEARAKLDELDKKK
jgi:tetratricopeptide (TPR) repeat protein